jgi:hypothetical protein
MPSVLVSGAPKQVSAVGEALRRRGAQVVEVTDLSNVVRACQDAGEGAFAAYVQLGASFRVQGDTAVQRVRHFYADGVLARFTALDAARPALAPGASVVFVMGSLPPDVASDADRAARRSLTNVLAQAVRADASPSELTIRVLDADIEADRVAALALGQSPEPRDAESHLEGLSLSDWRVELMGVVLVET